jgi:hypothetical protein
MESVALNPVEVLLKEKTFTLAPVLPLVEVKFATKVQGVVVLKVIV